MTTDPILTAEGVQHYARFEQLVASHEALRAERDEAKRKLLIEEQQAADMRADAEWYLHERDAAREREKQLEGALAILSEPTTVEFLADADRYKNQNEELDFAIYTLERIADRLGAPLAARSPGGQADPPKGDWH